MMIWMPWGKGACKVIFSSQVWEGQQLQFYEYGLR